MEALGGLAIGTLLGVTTAFVVSLFPASRDTVLPLAIAINAIPIIAFAPVANNWLGITSPLSKMAVAAALVYFPIMINVLRGLTQVEGSALELMRSYAASPAAVHDPAAGAERASLLPDRAQDRDHPQSHRSGGRRVLRWPERDAGSGGRRRPASSLRFDVTWAAILVVSLCGIVLYLVVVVLERVLIPWHPSMRGDQPA